jgi:hypothetical protein
MNTKFLWYTNSYLLFAHAAEPPWGTIYQSGNKMSKIQIYWLSGIRNAQSKYKRDSVLHTTKKTELRGLSPWANYTNRATAACRRSYFQLLRMQGATWSAWRIPAAVWGRILGFLDRSRYFFFQVAPQLYCTRPRFPTHHLLNVSLQIANKLGKSKNK